MTKINLSYTLSVLRKVSFNAELFSKEVRKASKYLRPSEWVELHQWLKRYTQDKPELQISLRYFNPSEPFVAAI